MILDSPLVIQSMYSSAQHRTPYGAIILAILSAIISILVIAALLSALGFLAAESTVIAIVGGVMISCFVWIERKLRAQVAEKDKELSLEIARHLEVQDALYSRSLACYVRFDAGTLIIDRATPGFVKMLRLPTDTDLKGRRLEEVLGINPLKLESVVESIKQGDNSVKQPKISISTKTGFTAHALISGIYVPEEHIIETAFFVPPVKNAERIADLEAAQKDLDRFRRGMFRRETRILELKEEVNFFCKKSGLSARYEIDKSTDESKLKLPSSRHQSSLQGGRRI